MEQWFYQDNQTRHGPVSAEEIKSLLAGGIITPSTLIWSKNLDDWKPLREVADFANAPSGVSPPPSPVADNSDKSEATNNGLADKLRALSDLHKEGILSDAEYASEKERLLSGNTTRGSSSDASGQQEEQPPCPPNNLAGAIFATLCCCLPFGIVAIIKATKVNGIYEREGYDAALAAAEDAKKWVLIAVAAGLVVGALQFLAGIAQEM